MLSNNIYEMKNKIKYATENEYNINRFNKLLNNLKIDYDIKLQGKTYVITFKKEAIKNIKFIKEDINIKKDEQFFKAVVRGAFLGGGSLNNPKNKYHFEIVFPTLENAKYISEILTEFDIKSKILERKNSYGVYIKEADEISKILALIGANKAVLNFEEIRVVRETRNNINRIVNCETANLNKTINAAVNQINAIKLLKKNKKFEELPKTLKEIANLRLKNPDASLVELGNMLAEPIGKSGVNHRLKKICELASEK